MEKGKVNLLQTVRLHQFVLEDKQDADEEQDHKVDTTEIEKNIEGEQKNEGEEVQERGKPESACNPPADGKREEFRLAVEGDILAGIENIKAGNVGHEGQRKW